MEERYIASVDLGTSKVSVCVAKVQGANVQVVYYKESPARGIRYSYVYNPKMVEDRLRSALSEAQQELRLKIHQVVVGLPRYEVRQETGSASIERMDEDSQIEESEVRTLKADALNSYPLENKNEVIYGAVAQSFSTEEEFNELENDIIGMTASKLEGNFKVFIGNRRHSSNLDGVFRGMGISIAKKYFTPAITAKAVLKDEQMENGVALVDLGAGVSSVTIFKGKIMRFYAAIPFGGNSITSDIKSECDISFALAESIKKAYGACLPRKLSSFGEKILQINDENGDPVKKIPVKYLSEIVTARMREIVEALLYEIQRSGYAREDQLRAGVVLTGGGSELVNCANLVKEMSGYSVKTAAPRPFFSCDGCELARTSGAATSMGMVLSAKGDRELNCAGFSSSWGHPVETIGPGARSASSPAQQTKEPLSSTDVGKEDEAAQGGAGAGTLGVGQGGGLNACDSPVGGTATRTDGDAVHNGSPTPAGAGIGGGPTNDGEPEDAGNGYRSSEEDDLGSFRPYDHEGAGWETRQPGTEGKGEKKKEKSGWGFYKWIKRGAVTIYDKMNEEEV